MRDRARLNPDHSCNVDVLSYGGADDDVMRARSRAHRFSLSSVAPCVLCRETVLASRATVRALSRVYDANADSLISFDEFLAARPGGLRNTSSDVLTLPTGWVARCGFGPAAVAGIWGWTSSAERTVVHAAHAGEWIGCHAPPALEARAHSSFQQHFELGESLAGVRLLAVEGLPRTRGSDLPAPQDVTHGLYTLVRGGVLQLTAMMEGTGASALFQLPTAIVSRFFRVSFAMHIGGGSGGDGISWSYGFFDDGYVDEMGTGDVRMSRV